MSRDTLSQEQIIKAAIDLLDAEGLEGLSMRALGVRLGSAATAVYWHVGSKDNLIALAGDHVWNEATLPDLTVVDWRTAAATMAVGLHDMLVRHLWLVQAFGSHMISGPGKARHNDHCLAIYEAAGLRGKEVDQAATAVFLFVLGNALGRAAEVSLKRRLAKADENTKAEMQERFVKNREIASQFPRLRARIGTASKNYISTPESTFEFGLHAILDGIKNKSEGGR
jgi:AcrR family transcriptional regulator